MRLCLQPCGLSLLAATPPVRFSAADSPTLAQASSALRRMSHGLGVPSDQGTDL